MKANLEPSTSSNTSAVMAAVPVNTDTLTPSRDGQRYRVLAYMRVSKERQEGNFTFETQEQRIREKLDRRYGPGNYELEVHQDDGLSGAYGPTATGIQKRTRATLVELEAKLKSGVYDCFIVYKLNRLFRSTRWIVQWLEDVITPSGVTFLSATEDLDLGTAMGLVMIKMISVMDESVRDGIVERNKDAQATRAEQGFLLGPPPYGWRRQPKEEVSAGGRRGIEPEPTEVPHVHFIVDKYLAGWGSTKIADDLNQRGVPSAEGARWNAGTVLGVLNSPVHCGFVRSKRKGLLPGQHYEQRFYDRERYQEIQRTREQRRKSGSTNTHKTDSLHLVNGIAHCARCGKRLFIYTGNGSYRAYRCQNGYNQGQRTCPDVTVRAEWIESAVEQELERLAQEPAMRELLMEQANQATAGEDEGLQQEQVKLQKKLKLTQDGTGRLLQKLALGTIDDEEFKQGNHNLRQEKQQLEVRLAEIDGTLANRQGREQWVQRVQQAVLDFPLCWSHLTLDERRQLLRTLIETLTVDRVGRDAVLRLKIHFLPEREIPIAFQSTLHMKDRPLGVQALTRRQLVFLHYVGQGKGCKEIAQLMGTTIACAYQWSSLVRKHLGIRDLQGAYRMAKPRIESLLPTLPLGPTSLCRVHAVETPVLGASLMEVLPFLVQGASPKEVAQLTGLTNDAVIARRKRILDVLRVKSIFQAAQKAKELGLL